MESFQARQAPTVIGPPKHYVHAKRRERAIHKCPTSPSSKGMTINGLPCASVFLAERPTAPPPPPPPTDKKSSPAASRCSTTIVSDAPPRPPPPHTPSSLPSVAAADAVSLLSPSTKSRILELRRRKSVAASVLASSLAGFASPSSPASSSSRLDGSAVGGSEDDAAGRRRRRQLRRAASAPLGTTSSVAAVASSAAPPRRSPVSPAVPPLPPSVAPSSRQPPAGWRGSPSSRPRRASRRAPSSSDRPPPAASGSTTTSKAGLAPRNADAENRRSLPSSASPSLSSSRRKENGISAATKDRVRDRKGTASGLAVVSHPRGSKSVVAAAPRRSADKSGRANVPSSSSGCGSSDKKKKKGGRRRDGDDASVRSAPSPRGKGGAGKRDYDKPWLATSTTSTTTTSASGGGGGCRSAKKKTTSDAHAKSVATTGRRTTTSRSLSSPSLGPKKPAYRRTSRESANTVESTPRRPSSTKGTPSSSSLRPKPKGTKTESASRRAARQSAETVESSRSPPTGALPVTPTKNYAKTDKRDAFGSESSSSSCWTVVGSPNKCKSMPACTPPRHPVATPPPLSKLPSLEETEDESDFLLSAFEDPPSTPPRERGAAVSPLSLPPSSSVSAKKRRTRRKLSTTPGGLGGPRGLGELAAKVEEIDAILRGNNDDEDGGESVDLWRLRELALSEGGLVNDALRKRAWPMLAGLHGKPPGADGRPIRRRPPPTSVSKASTAGNAGPGGSDIPPCQDDDLIEKDAKRTTSHLLAPSQRALHAKRQSLPYKDRKKLAARLRRKQRNLGDLIRLSLVPPPSKIEEGEVEGDDEEAPRYYQGYHDVASVFLSALRGGSDGSSSSGGPAALDDSAASSSNHRDLDLPARVLRSVLSTHLRDYARPTMSSLLTALRIIIMPLLELFDPDVHDRLLETDVEPYFALGWVASWFAHDVSDTPTAKRLCDAFLAGHPSLPFYVSIAVVSHPTNRERILNAEPDLPGVMGALQGLPRNSGRRSTASADDDDANVDDESSTGTCDAATVGSLDGSLASLSDASESSSSFLDRGGSTDATSHPSAGGDASVVPMQELIDLAVSYMERAPPQNLLSISRRYHKEYSDDDLTETTLLPDEEASTTVHLFRSSPPKSVAASTCPSERALERMALEEKARTTRRARRRRLELRRGASLPSDVGAGEASSPSSASPSLSTGASRRRVADSSDHCRAAKIAAGVAFDDEESGPTMDRARSALKSASAALFSGITWALGKAEQMPPQ